MGKLKIAIIGVGGISNFHIKSYLQNSQCELYAFCDINPDQLKKMGERYGVTRLFTDKDDMFRACPEIDAVSVCTWNSAHAECSIAALNAGKHVLCEKPMAMNAEEAEAMAAAAARNNRLLMIGFVRRHGEDCRVLKDFIDAGELGDIYYAKATFLRRAGAPGGWFGDKSRSGGGPLIDLGVHVIDLARYLAGKPQPVSVYGATFYKLGNRGNLKSANAYVSETVTDKEIFDVEDLATALVRFDNGMTLSVETSFNLNLKEDVTNTQLFGTKAGAMLCPDVEIFSDRYNRLVNTSFHDRATFDFESAFPNEINHYVSCITDGTPCLAPAEDGVVLMKILDAIYRSAATGHEVTL